MLGFTLQLPESRNSYTSLLTVYKRSFFLPFELDLVQVTSQDVMRSELWLYLLSKYRSSLVCLVSTLYTEKVYYSIYYPGTRGLADRIAAILTTDAQC
ncbi:hypothetical protein AFLA_005886 [Aspergillus flavus NRRL3357]|nr:hypothetical protein AFLA_005886 [Aspergillus flavus NRRL3357]